MCNELLPKTRGEALFVFMPEKPPLKGPFPHGGNVPKG